MGQEVVYCSKCRKRILGSEYAKGHAYLVENQICCSACAVQLLETLPAGEKEQLLARMFKATQQRQSITSSSLKAQGGGPPETRPRAPAPPPAPKSKLPVLGGAAVLAAALILSFVASSKSSPPPSPPPARIAKPAAVNSPLSDPGLSPEEKRREEKAKFALKKARAFAETSPKDLGGQVLQWKSAVGEATGTGYEAEAKRELEKAEAQGRAAETLELGDFDRRMKSALEKRDVKAALGILGEERLRRGSPAWKASLDRMEAETRDAAGRFFADEKVKAIAARDQGRKVDVEKTKAAVAAWGIPDYVVQLDQALLPAWRALFDGKTTSFLANASAPYWKVVDGALTQAGSQDQAGQSAGDFEDGEFRFRFTAEGGSQVYVAVRQGNGWSRVAIYRDVLRTWGSGEHEILFTCRGAVISATVDGKPAALESSQPIPPRGRIQFNAKDGTLRLLGLDWRPLP